MNSSPAAATAAPPSFSSLARGLEHSGYAVLPEGLPIPAAQALRAYAGRVRADDFHAAAVGRGPDEQRNRFVRRDRIHWLNERDPSLECWRDWTESLRLHLNERLFLGLFSFESHLAHYRPGDFYRTHLDAFRGEANRVVSLVCYLNEDWTEGDGGELVLHTDLGAVTVAPVHRTVVLFLSEEMPHEVRPARRDRYSVAGWFRLNASSPDRVDPPR
ncbi:MAG: 2OG-Fe(II) oxygenase [Gammaproteobacteria bacterium]